MRQTGMLTAGVLVGGDGFYVRSGKRWLDLALVALAAPLAVPVIALVALAVMLDGHAPLIAQERVGQNGMRFRCWKLRSMVPDAAAALARHLAECPEARADWDRDCKLRNDPRVTWLGRILRATSLDELPQLWNVLRGDMSIVGPRPVTAAEIPRYGVHVRDYTAVRPGITGKWQVSGRNHLTYDERVALDCDYVRGLGLFADLAIIARTVLAVLRKTGC